LRKKIASVKSLTLFFCSGEGGKDDSVHSLYKGEKGVEKRGGEPGALNTASPPRRKATFPNYAGLECGERAVPVRKLRKKKEKKKNKSG